MLVGTYTPKGSKGIYVYKLDTINGIGSLVSDVAVKNPSFLTVNKSGNLVYSVSENEDKTSAVNAFSFDKTTGKLILLNTIPAGGGAPCHITLDAAEKHITTANYLGGSLSLFTLKDDGTFDKIKTELFNFTGKGADSVRQKQPHIHCTVYSPDNKYLFATDLGTDQIHKFQVNESGNFLSVGSPSSFKVAEGSGPRHLTFHPNGKFAYLITELSGDVITYNYSDGNLVEVQTIKADTLGAKGSADIHVSPDGRFLYASNRIKGDGIAIFSIDATNGALTKIGYQSTGGHPRNFAFTPTGNMMLVACRDADAIELYAVDKNSGLLRNIDNDIRLSMPVCIQFISTK